MAIASLLVLFGLWVIFRARGGVKWLFGGKDRYAGFEDAYEMPSTGPPVPYAGLPGSPGPQWMPQPYYVAQPAPYPAPQVPKSDASVYR